MKKDKTVKRWIPVNLYDISGMESWLADLAAEGLFLEKFATFFAHLKREKPQKAIYRFEPVTKEEKKPDEEILEFYNLSGWSYITRLNSLFYIYMSVGEGAPELHTDPIAQSYSYEKLHKKLRNSMYLIVLLVFAMAVMIASVYLFHKQPILYLVEGGQFFNQIVLMLVELFVTIQCTSDAKNIKKLIRHLQSGIPAQHKKNYKAGKNIRLFVHILVTVAAVITILFPIYTSFKCWDKNMNDIAISLPMVPLEVIEQNSNFKYRNDISYQGGHYANHVFYK